MTSISFYISCFILLPLFFSFSSAQKCSSYSFPLGGIFPFYVSCIDLPELESYLHWGWDSNTKILYFAYRQPGVKYLQEEWIAWGVNPTSLGMIGSQIFVCTGSPSGVLRFKTTNITNRSPSMNVLPLKFPVVTYNCYYESNEAIIYGSIVLNQTKWNTVWQRGQMTDAGDFGPHPMIPANLEAKAVIDFDDEQYEKNGDEVLKAQNRVFVHAILSMVGWGILMPIGALIARYLKDYDLTHYAWFHMHRTCQTIAYVIATAGWGYGVKLGGESRGIEHSRHKDIGILQFVLATIQAFSFIIRPRAHNEYIVHWDTFHHINGSVIIVASIINIRQGFGLMAIGNNIETACMGISFALVATTLVFESIKRVSLSRQSKEKNETNDSIVAGTKALM